MASQARIIPSLLYSSANVYTEYLLGLVVSIVIARSLGPEEFGVYALIVWVSALSITLINAGISVAAVKFTSELAGRGQTSDLPLVEQHLITVQLYKAVVFAVLMAIIALFTPSIIVEEDQVLLLWIIIPAVLFKSFHMFQVAIIKGHQEFRSLARIAFITAPLNVLFVTIAYFFSPTVLGYLVAFLCTCVVYLVASNSSMKSIRSATKHKTSTGLAPELKNRVNKLLGYTSLIILFAYIVFGQSELLFLKHMGAASDLAFFSVGFVLARSASALIPGVYNNILLSRISFAVGKDENEATTAFLTASRHMLILGLLCAIPLAVFAEDIVLFLYGDAYQPAYLPTFVFSLVAVLAVIRDTTNAYLVSNDRQPLILRIVFILFCATIILDYFLILELGLLGAVIAYAVIETMAAAVLSFYAFRMLGHWPDMGKILRTIVAAAATALIACILAALLNFPGGFIIGGALCPVVFIISLALFDAFEDEDYRAVQPFVAERSDRLSRMLASTIHARLETSSRSIKRQG